MIVTIINKRGETQKPFRSKKSFDLESDGHIVINFISLETLAADHIDFCVKTFPKSTAKSSLIHLKREIEEVTEEIDRNKKLIEYADCLGCLFSAIAFDGYTINQIADAFAAKLAINQNRTWKLNPDNTCSHVK